MARKSLKNIFDLIDVAKDELPIEQSFLNDLRRSIEISDEKNYKEPSRTYKPSGMNCIRRSFYQITGQERQFDTSNILIGICESGSDRHQRIQQAVLDMNSNGIECEYVNVADFVRLRGLDEYLDIVQEPDFSRNQYETKLFHKSLNMSFLCDGIIRYKNHHYILEIKTESSNKFMMRKGVDPSHYNQATAYSIAFGINEVIFLYECRDNCDKKAFLFEVTDEMKQNLLGYIEECDSYIKKLKVPPKPEDVPKKTCSYCEYSNLCRKDSV